jgi:hypothetical protein
MGFPISPRLVVGRLNASKVEFMVALFDPELDPWSEVGEKNEVID